MTPTVLLYATTHAELARVCHAVDVTIADPPFGARTHAGQTHARRDATIGLAATGLGYDAWSPRDIAEFVNTWAPRTRRWFCAFASHDQIGPYEIALRACGRYVFAPIACVTLGANVRLAGDGPANWTSYLIVSRPVSMRPLSGALRGAYVGPRERTKMRGGKPLWLMRAIVRDYVRLTDVVCDPCAGSGTTLIAARAEGRTAIGAEPDPARFAVAQERLMTMPRTSVYE